MWLWLYVDIRACGYVFMWTCPPVKIITLRGAPVKTIAVLSQKGGSGKSTITLHLAVAAEQDGKTAAVIDLDPQVSATEWADRRAADSPAVLATLVARLPQILEAARANQVQFAFIDTASHTESNALAAAREADFILIPCRASAFDIRAIKITVDLVRMAKKPAAFILNAVPPRGGRAAEASAALEEFGILIAPVHLVHRAAFFDALTDGRTAQEYEPNGKAAEEIAALYRWLCEYVGM